LRFVLKNGSGQSDLHRQRTSGHARNANDTCRRRRYSPFCRRQAAAICSAAEADSTPGTFSKIQA
jgi:hypothetical protein